MESRPVAVHQDHGRGEVEATSRQNPDGRSGVEGLAGHHPRGVEVEAAAREHQDGEHRHGHDPGHTNDGDAPLHA